MYLQSECTGKFSKMNDLSKLEATMVGFADRNCGIPRIWS
jgi:hypothetical protein